MTDFKKMLADGRLPERTVPVCLRGDLAAEFEDLERQLLDVQRANTDSLEDTTATHLAEQLEALRAQMREHTYTFRLRALPKPKYRALKALHPPRKDPDTGEIVAEDVMLDANFDEFLEPLLRACLIDPQLDDADWAELEQKLTDNQYTVLASAALYVNRGGVDIPFSHAASRLLRTSETE